MFSKIKAAISGKKTYLVAAAAILTAVVAWSQNQISLWELGKTVFAAVGTMTMRAAVTKSAATMFVTNTLPSIPPTVNFHGGGTSETIP